MSADGEQFFSSAQTTRLRWRRLSKLVIAANGFAQVHRTKATFVTADTSETDSQTARA